MKNHPLHIITDTVLVKYLQGQTSEQENKIIRSWISDNQENQDHFNRLKKLWEHSDPINDFDSIDVNSEWEKVRNRINNVRPEIKTRKLNSTFFFILRIAAIIVLAVGITFIIRYYIVPDPEMMVHSTELNQSEILLSDGSKVYLNKHSKISYPEKFSRNERVVNLKGEAYFEVFRNEKKSFIVRTNTNADIKVLGTSFNIHEDSISSAVTVHVTSGKVAFYKSDDSTYKTILTENEKAILEDNIISKSKIENPNFLSWKTGILEFDNSPLKNVTEELVNFYKQPILIDDQSVSDLKYTSTIDNQPLEEVLDEIKLVFNLEYILKSDTIFLYPNQ